MAATITIPWASTPYKNCGCYQHHLLLAIVIMDFSYKAVFVHAIRAAIREVGQIVVACLATCSLMVIGVGVGVFIGVILGPFLSVFFWLCFLIILYTRVFFVFFFRFRAFFIFTLVALTLTVMVYTYVLVLQFLQVGGIELEGIHKFFITSIDLEGIDKFLIICLNLAVNSLFPDDPLTPKDLIDLSSGIILIGLTVSLRLIEDIFDRYEDYYWTEEKISALLEHYSRSI